MGIDQIRNELQEKVKTIDPIGKVLKFNLDNNFIVIDGVDTNKISSEDREADCVITMSIATYLKLQKKEIKPLIATLTGKLKIKGNLGLARKLKQLM